jgi:rod shape determining protein RodA
MKNILTVASQSLLPKKTSVDWISFTAAFALCLLGLLTMDSFDGSDPLFIRQIIWIGLGVVTFFAASIVDWRFLRRSGVAGGMYAVVLIPLVILVVLGHATKGAKSWFDLGPFALQPVEFVKLAVVIVLAKYFSRRHIEIRNIRHVLVSGIYVGIVFGLVAIQPDFGSAVIIFLIWLGMVSVSGISKLHLGALFMLGIIAFSGLWFFGFHDYQRARIMNFIHPTADIHGTGYNAYQSTVAVGSGQLLGKGVGYGTQSKLRFLPEYQTDFIFAAFAEEWGFVGILIVFALYLTIFVQILRVAARGASNFETLFALGIFFYLLVHFVLHVGINMGVLPVTGTTIPFMSYGGSHLLAEFLALGMLSGMDKYSRAAHRESLGKEFKGGYSGI